MRRFLPRFSLLTVLFVMTIVALAIIVVKFWSEVADDRRDLSCPRPLPWVVS